MNGPVSFTRRTCFMTLLSLMACQSVPSAPPKLTVRNGRRVWQLTTENGSIDILEDDPGRGPLSAAVWLVLFSDFQCPFCKDFAATLDQVLSSMQADVRLVFMHLPLPMHSHARQAAIASYAVLRAQGEAAFWKLHDALFLHQSTISAGLIDRLCRELSVTEQTVREYQKEAENKLENVLQLAEQLALRGTPSLCVQGRIARGVLPELMLRRWISNALEQALAKR